MSPARPKRRTQAPARRPSLEPAEAPVVEIADWRLAAAMAVAGVVAFLVFRGTFGHGFVNWDDGIYVYENPALRHLSSQTLAWFFTRFYYFAYIPVTLSSYAFDVIAWGAGPRGHHLANVLLHAANAAWIVFLGVALSAWGRPRAGARATEPSGGHAAALWGAGAAALLWAVHPLRAESVAWISDRKDLLCAFFLLPATIAYIAAREGAPRRGLWLTVSFLCFFLAALSKANAVVFPVVLLLLDWMNGRRGWELLVEKIPFFVVAAAIAGVTLAMTPHTRPTTTVAQLTGVTRALLPFHSLAYSLFQTAAPARLSPIYPSARLGWSLAAGVVLAAITLLAIARARRGRKGLLAAWLAYLVVLAPNVIGVGSGLQPVADRYSYLATIPLFVLAGFGIAVVWERAGAWRRVALGAVLACVLVLLGALAARQAGLWRSSESLWAYVIREFPPTADYIDAYVNLSAAYDREGKRAEAKRVLERAAAIDPRSAKVQYNLGIVSYFLGDRARALACLRRATELDSTDAMAFYNRALISGEAGYVEESVTSMTRAARMGLLDAQEALHNRGMSW
ncbi:MAG: tetratricopeptide repeat protein [Bacteroidota bacterium]